MNQIGTLTEMAFIRRIARRLAAVFSCVATYRLTIPVYCDGEYCFMAASQSTPLQDIPEEVLAQRLRKVRGWEQLSYYTPPVHRASQVMPPRYETGLATRRGSAS